MRDFSRKMCQPAGRRRRDGRLESNTGSQVGTLASPCLSFLGVTSQGDLSCSLVLHPGPPCGPARQAADSHVLGCVGEEVRVLRGRVLGAVGGCVADDHEHGPVWVHLLGCAEEAHAVIGDEVCEVILGAGEQGTGEGPHLCQGTGRTRLALPPLATRPS